LAQNGAATAIIGAAGQEVLCLLQVRNRDGRGAVTEWAGLKLLQVVN
jgi:hypothetical protein